MIINIDEIKNLLPHREPFLFVDKCEITEVGIQGVGYRKFLPNEFFFKGHFPELPIVPGVILIEALAQTAGIVVSKAFDTTIPAVCAKASIKITPGTIGNFGKCPLKKNSLGKNFLYPTPLIPTSIISHLSTNKKGSL